MDSNYRLKKYKYKWIIFLISPLLSIVFSFKNLRVKDTVNLVWAFVAFFGWSMVPYTDQKDSSAYRNKLQLLYNSEESQNNFLSNFYELGGETDILIPLLIYLTSFITENGSVLFLLFGIVFGYFYSRNLGFILDITKNSHQHFLIVFLVFCLLLIIPFWSINGIRFWTAAHVVLWCVLSYCKHEKGKYYVLLFFTPLIHFSFIFVVLIFFVWKIFDPKNSTLLLILFFISYFFSYYSISFVVELIQNYAPSFAENEVKSYTHPDLIISTQKGRVDSNWYVRYFLRALNLGVYILFYILIFRFGKKVFIDNQFLIKLTSFALFFGVISNLFSVIPSFSRFTKITTFLFLFLCISFIINILNLNKKIPKITFVPIFLIFFWLVVNIRDGMDFISLGTLSNPIIALVQELNDTALINLIK